MQYWICYFSVQDDNWSAWSNPKFIYVSLFFSSTQMWYNKKPAYPSVTSRLLKKSPSFEINMQQKAESTAKA